MGAMSKLADREGLSVGYRFGYWVRYHGLGVFGPAQLGESEDPRQRMKRDRAAKVEAVRRARREDGPAERS